MLVSGHTRRRWIGGQPAQLSEIRIYYNIMNFWSTNNILMKVFHQILTSSEKNVFFTLLGSKWKTTLGICTAIKNPHEKQTNSGYLFSGHVKVNLPCKTIYKETLKVFSKLFQLKSFSNIAYSYHFYPWTINRRRLKKTKFFMLKIHKICIK